ncbi:uncharacterized protein LTR77_007754 [Saxophila tyrrhenica]|uniref:Laccase n=1 Tax=Saxophila tyrrhenica TaxID=1690608 RepID=A0AAV9P3H1_9PEZI|nr:hypothetical protein LTR77_007754 [Saxophila tyrrhenica]
MKTTSWSLAFAAGAAATAPPTYGDDNSAPPAYGWSSEAAPESSSAPAAYSSIYASSSAGAYSSSAVPSVYPSSSSGYAVSSSASASFSGPACTTTYTSTCEETSTLIYRSSTEYEPYKVTHTLTTTMEGECPSSMPVYGSSSAGAISSSESVPVYPASSSATAVYPSGSAPASPESSLVPSEYSSMVVPVSPESSSPAGYPSGGHPSMVVVTNTVTNTKYVCPCETTPEPTRTPGEVYVTSFTTEYETTCPGGDGETATFTYGDWTSIYTKYSMTTYTDTITSTVTEPEYPASSGPAVYPSGSSGSPEVPSASGPAAYPSASGSSGAPASSEGWGYPGASSSASGPAGYPSASGSSSASAPGDYGSVSESASASLPPYPYGSSSSSGVAYPTGTSYSSSSYSLIPTGSSSSAAPTGTGACVPCEGQPGNDPEKWCGYDINDNWYAVTPKTCRTVEYFWTIKNETISPDGVPRMGLVIEGGMPGPLIEANWGDEVIVHLTNGLDIEGLNGTSLHFHGIRQNHTNEMDGVSSITQCPIAPGHSMTYKWTATSYGTSWWHSHYALQLYEGIWGPMIIHGPASAEYDDEQFVALQDWNHIPVDTLFKPSEIITSPSSGPQTLDTGLINGMNVWEGAGKRFEMTVQSGKSYRLRLLNSAIQSTFVFYVDQHELEVIAMDLVPITPYSTNMVVINIGQRYDLILKANQPSADYWMRSDNQQPCGQLKNLDIKGIVHYADGPMAEPTSEGYGYAPTCLDEPLDKLVPIVPWDAGAVDQTISEAAVIGPYPGTNLFKWTLSGTTFFSEWEHPTLKQIYEDGTVPDTSGNLAIEVPELHEWVYIIIQTPIPLPHPIHLHGHDFLILAQGLGQYSDSVALNLKSPPRRDTAVMPADPTQGQPGYLVLAFQTSNPGVWLLHCHIGWHNAMGFALQIIENLEGIADTIKYGGQIEDTCSAWSEYAAAYNIVTEDSGV